MYFKSRICPAYIFIVDCLSPFYLALHFQGTLWLEWCLKLVKGASHIAEEIFAGGDLRVEDIVYIVTFVLQFFHVVGYWKCSNKTPTAI